MRIINFKTFLLSALFMVTACDSEELLLEAEGGVQSRSSITDVTTVDFDVDQYFDSITAPERWIQYDSFKEKLKVLNLPEDILPKLSTEQLAEACSKYPLRIVYMAYETPEEGAQAVIENFNGFQELSKRYNYQGALIDEYIKKNSPDVKTYSDKFCNVESKWNYSDFDPYYMEAIFQTDYFRKNLSTAESIRLSSHLDNMLKDEIDSSYFSKNSKMAGIDGLNTATIISNAGNIKGYTFVFTPYGKPVLVYDREDYPDYYVETVDNDWKSAFPKAKLLASSTYTYNCHFYAWHGVSSKKYWMDWKVDNYNGKSYPNIQNYTTDDGYTPQSYYAGVAYVFGIDSNGKNDHSMLYYPSTKKYVSKWGRGPLMEHSFEDMPYAQYLNKDDFDYYYRLQSTGPMAPIGADRAFQVGEEITLNIQANMAPHLTYQAEVLNGKGEDAVDEGKATLVYNGRETLKVTFHFHGLYDVTVTGKDKSGIVRQTFAYQAAIEM